jgi:hypothetical protein
LANRQYSKSIFGSHGLPKPVLVQPNGICIPGDVFLDRQTVNQLRAQNPFLFAIDKERLELPLSLSLRSLFGGGSTASCMFHVD